MGNKLSTLQYLKDIGLNTPRLLLHLSSRMDIRDRKRVAREWIKDMPEKISIRTDSRKDTDFKLPHYPNIKNEEAIYRIKQILEDTPEIEIIIFEGIDPSNCIFRGNLVYTNPSRWILEYAEGPGTVRDIDNNPKTKHVAWTNGTPHVKTDGIWASDFPDKLLPIVNTYKDNINRFKDKILEWSIYRNPVGYQSQNEIYWELRPWS